MRLNSNRLSSYASDASDKIPDGNEIAFFRAGENAIVVNENLTIPPWAFCIYIPFGRDAGLIVVGIGKVIAAYRMNSTWTYDTAIEALEKQIPIKMKDMRAVNDFLGRYYTCIGTCPICGEENIYRNSNYCHKCGQALDWEEVNNNEL